MNLDKVDAVFFFFFVFSGVWVTDEQRALPCP